MMRLTATCPSEGVVVVTVEGWVTGGDVSLLDHEIARHLEGAKRLVLDLDGVRSIEGPALELLNGWSDKGVLLRGGSTFVRALLEGPGEGVREQHDEGSVGK